MGGLQKYFENHLGATLLSSIGLCTLLARMNCRRQLFLLWLVELEVHGTFDAEYGFGLYLRF